MTVSSERERREAERGEGLIYLGGSREWVIGLGSEAGRNRNKERERAPSPSPTTLDPLSVPLTVCPIRTRV